MSFDNAVHDLYQDVIMDRGRKPRHAGRLESFDATARGDNPMCGDKVELWLARDAMGKISRLGFEARGCAISIASADLMAETALGRDAPAIKRLAAEFATLARTGDCPDCDAALEALRPLSGVHEFPSRVKCATLPWHALIAALDGAQEASSE